MILSNWKGSVSWTTHSGCQPLSDRSKAFGEIKQAYIGKSHLWPLISHHETHQLQCSSLAQMKTHYHHLFRGENVTSSLSFTSGGGLHRRTTIAYWMRESTLKCFRLILSLHTWCKVIGSTRVRTQHCTFSRDKMVHSRHWSTIVQDLINFCRPLFLSQPRTSLPSPHWLQQWTNHISTLSYLVTFISSTQCREQAPDQIS